MLCDPLTVAVGSQSTPPARLAHTVYPVSPPHKTALLMALLARPAVAGVLVFTRTKHRADRLTHTLDGAGFRVTCLHGDRTQPQRLQALEGFRRGTYQILVATDLAARGLDIERISHVVNYDVPGCPEDYVHRVGRTARAGADGEALTLMTPADTAQIRASSAGLVRRCLLKCGRNILTPPRPPRRYQAGPLTAHRVPCDIFVRAVAWRFPALVGNDTHLGGCRSAEGASGRASHLGSPG